MRFSPRRLLRRPTPAMVVALVALFVAIGGSSYAALRVGSGSIVNNSIRSVDVRNNSLRGKDIRNGTVRGKDVGANTLTGSDIVESSLGTVPSASHAASATSASRAGSANPELFARVDEGGNVYSANSKGISSANVTFDNVSTYCFHGLPFQPRSGQVTVDYHDSGGPGQHLEFSLGGITECPAGTQAFVWATDPNHSSQPSGFHIVFYR